MYAAAISQDIETDLKRQRTATLHDLDVLSTSTSNGPTVLALVDRTRTRVGREVLRRRLGEPASTSEQITALQDAHQAIAARAREYRAVLDRIDADGVEHYLQSRWQLPEERSAFARVSDALWSPAWFHEYRRDVRSGQQRLVNMLGAIVDLSRLLSSSDVTLLRDAGSALGEQLSAPDIRLLREWRAEFVWTQMAFDQLARGRARPSLLALLESFGTVEAMWSLAMATREQGWCYPRPGPRFRTTGIFHPFLAQPVVNDIDLADGVHVCFVTGPNMAGKSTFLKAVGIAMVLAHSGCGVPATGLEFPVVASIFARLQIVDNMTRGESLFLAEVRAVRSLATALLHRGSAFAILDEPFRGTNVHDAADTTLAVVLRLAAHPRAMVFVSSHLTEIVPALDGDMGIGFFHFAADATQERLQFDYRLNEGVSTQRLGMTLLEHEHVLEVLDRAIEAGRGR
jgi:DNA mismatch repair protein MutS